MTNRLLLGRHPTSGTYGLKVSLPGKDVLTITDAKDFAFDSGWDEHMNLIASGDAYANSSSHDASWYYPLVSFTTQAFTPHVWLFMNGQPYVGGVFGLYVSTSEIRVREGNIYNGYSCPTGLISYYIFNSSIV